MLDIEFTDVVTLREARPGTRKNASGVVWDPVLHKSNEPVSIECRIMRTQKKDFSNTSVEDVSDATLLFRVHGAEDITREQLVVDEFGQAYKVLGVDIQREKYGDGIYKRVRLQLTDKTFPVSA